MWRKRLLSLQDALVLTVMLSGLITAAFLILPGSGEINYRNVYQAIQKAGYAGYVAMEYLPLGDPVDSLTKALNDFRSALV